MFSVLDTIFSIRRPYNVYIGSNRNHVFICCSVCRAKLKLLGRTTYMYVIIGHTPNLCEHTQIHLEK